MYLSSWLFVALLLKSHLIEQTASSNATNATTGSKCPTFFVPYNDSGECVCAKHDRNIICDQDTRKAQVLAGVCATFNDTENSVVTGQCPYTDARYLFQFVQLPRDVTQLNSFMCGSFNRTGKLCSQCMPGLGPPVFSGSPNCVKCSNSRHGWLIFTALGILAPIFLCIVVMIFRINALSPSMNAFIITCHLISIFLTIHRFDILQLSTGKNIYSKVFFTFYGLWNMDFLRYCVRPYCISHKLISMDVQALEYVTAFCPLIVLVVLFICVELHDGGCKPIVTIWRPFHKSCVRFRRSWEPKGSIINTFATFLLLSYTKVFNVSLSLLFPVQVRSTSGTVEFAPLYDASLPYFAKNHKLYCILAAIILLVFNLLPPVFLLLYPLKIVQRCLGRLPHRFINVLNTFADAFQGCYKNGTGATTDCRYFAGLYLVFRIVLSSQVYLSNYTSGLFQALTCVFIAMLIATVHPYKKKFYTCFDGWSFILIALALMYMWFLSFENSRLSLIPMYILFGFPAFYIGAYLILRVLPQMRCIKVLIKTVKTIIFDTHRKGDDSLPHRLEHPSEYSPLLPQAGSLSLPQDTQREAAAPPGALHLNRSNIYGATI